ncbi:MAG: hypothetical protein IPL43_14865 [Micropruina sp.]|nr:hypothetical protein [Micropruina sp.]
MAVLKVLVVALAALELENTLRNPRAEGALGLGVGLASTAAVVTSLRWPIIGSAVTAVLVALPLILTWNGYELLPLLVAPVALAANERRRYIVSFFIVDALLLLARLPTWPTVSVAVGMAILVATTATGLIVRSLNARVASADLRIKALRRSIAEIRRSERSRLADELSRVVGAAGSDTEKALGRARASTDASSIEACLHSVESASRGALAGIRRLIATLRGPRAPGSAGPANVNLLASVEGLEEALVGHGYTVELSGFGDSTPINGAGGPLFERAVHQAAEHMRERAPAGSTCGFDLNVDDFGTTLSAWHPVDAVASEKAWSELQGEATARGGRLDVGPQGERWVMRLTMPAIYEASAQGTERPRSPSASGRSEPVKGVRVGVSLAALLSAGYHLIALLTAPTAPPLDTASRVLWVATFVAVGLVVWAPRTGLGALATALGASVALSEPAVALGEPAQLAIVALTATVTVLRVRWLLALLPGWALLVAVWVEPSSWDLDHTIGIFLYAPFGAMLGLAVRHYLASRKRHLADLERLAVEQASAREQERRHLAGELHDMVAHQLTLITMHVMSNRQPASVADLHGLVAQLADLNRGAQSELALLVTLMQPDVVSPEEPGEPSQLSVSEALSGTTEALTLAGFSLAAEVSPDVDACHPTTGRTLTRILREASTNVLRYAEPGSPCRINLSTTKDAVEASVVSVLPPRRRQHHDSTGWGLAGLSERIALTGGQFSAGRRGGEWHVAATLPRWLE